MKKIRVVDFFCGCGGTSAGLRASGMTILAGIDCDSEAGKTFRMNFPRATYIDADIAKLRASALDDVVPYRRDFPILFSACAPCQPFSKHLSRNPNSDERKEILDHLHRFLRRYKPDYFFLENVPGLQNIGEHQGPFIPLILLLHKLGYHHEHRVVRSQDYGVPQYRQRLLLVAARASPIDFPNATHGPGADVKRYRTVWDSIADLPEIAAGETDGSIANHDAAGLSLTNLERIRATPPGGGRNDWPKRLVLNCHENHHGHSDVYGRMHKNKPASALTTRCNSLSNGRYGHPEQDRAISIREAARLQTFPDEFEFVGSMKSMARQIGNAVPPQLVRTIGKHVALHFRKSNYQESS